MGEVDVTRIFLVVGAALVIWQLFYAKLGVPSPADLLAKFKGSPTAAKPSIPAGSPLVEVNTVELVQEWNKFRSIFTRYTDASGKLPPEIQVIVDKVDALYGDLNVHLKKGV